jgi:hypothetical protein
MAGTVDRPFVLADLSARVEAHASGCIGARPDFRRRMAEDVQVTVTKLPTDPVPEASDTPTGRRYQGEGPQRAQNRVPAASDCAVRVVSTKSGKH